MSKINVKIFIATPAFDGKVTVPYAISLSETVMLLSRHLINVENRITVSGSLLCAERNRLIDSFMLSDCTHMLCIDSDLGWPAQAVIEMLKKNVEFVAGCYPARGEKTFLFRPEKNEDDSIVVDKELGLLKMQYIPAGFMLLQRSVIEKMMKQFPETYFKPKAIEYPSGYALFNTEVWQEEFWGEDYVFCRRARESGVDIWVDPLIEFNHAGNIGCISSILTDAKPVEEAS